MLDRFRTVGEAWLNPLADRLAPAGADRLTWASLVAAAAAGVCFTWAEPRAAYFLVIGALFVLSNAVLDALDGIVSRKTGSASPAGDFLDHALDRYADLFIIGGLAASGFGDFRWGFFAVTGVFLTSYMGTQAAAVGLKRDYGGLLGRADRLLLLTLVPLVQAALVYTGLPSGLTVPVPGRGPGNPGELFTLVDLLLLLFALLGHATALQRFVRGRFALLDREGKLGPPKAPPAPAGPPTSQTQADAGAAPIAPETK